MHKAFAAILVTLLVAGAALAAGSAPAARVTAPNQPVAVDAQPVAAPAPAVESTQALAAPAPAVESTRAAVRPAPTDANDPNNWVIQRGIASSDAGLTETSTSYGDMMKIMLSLAAVIAVIALAVWGFKRFAPRTASMFASENLKVVSRTYLGPKQAIYLVKAPGCLLVIASTQEKISLLSEIKDPVEIERVIGAAHAASSKSQTRIFTNVLSGLTGAAKDNDAETEAELAEAVKSVSERFASLNRRLDAFESKTD